MGQSPLLLYDGFNYTAGELLAPLTDTAAMPMPGQLNVEYNVNWRYAGGGGATNEPPEITEGTLSATGLPPAVGNSALFDHSQLGFTRIEIPNAAASGTRFYWSGLFRVNTLGNLRSTVMLPGATNGVFLGGFNNVVGPGTTINSGGAILIVRPDFETSPLEPKPDSYQIGTGVTTNNNDKVFAASAPQAVGSTVFLVASYELVAGTENDIVKMWINPAASTYGAAEDMLPAETLLSANTADIASNDLPSVLSFQLRNNNAIYENTNWQFDELRVGTTWASVTSAVTPSFAGDFNGDNKVDGADLSLWQGGFGTGATKGQGDADGDADVDGADFLIWQQQVGGGLSVAAASAVPEPAAAWLASATMVGALGVRVRPRRRA
jgi:hypothetical protein